MSFIKIAKTRKKFDAIFDDIIENLNINQMHELINEQLCKKIIYCNCRLFVNFALIFKNILFVNDINNKFKSNIISITIDTN